MGVTTLQMIKKKVPAQLKDYKEVPTLQMIRRKVPAQLKDYKEATSEQKQRFQLVSLTVTFLDKSMEGSGLRGP